MNEVNSKKIIDYSKTAAKGAVVGAAIGSPFLIKDIVDIRKFSKLTKNPPSDCFEQLAQNGKVALDKESAKKVGEILSESAKNSNTMKDIIKSYESLSRHSLKNSIKLCACCASLVGIVGVLVHCLKDKINENQIKK